MVERNGMRIYLKINEADTGCDVILENVAIRNLSWDSGRWFLAEFRRLMKVDEAAALRFFFNRLIMRVCNE